MLWNGRGIWKLRAMPLRVRRYAGSFEISSPWNSIEPPSFRSDPEMQLMSVVLPEPLGPISPERSAPHATPAGITESESCCPAAGYGMSRLVVPDLWSFPPRTAEQVDR